MTGRILAGSNIVEVRQGDSFNIKLKFNAKNKQIDLSAMTITMQVRQKNDDALVFQKQAEKVDEAIGVYLLRLSPAETSAPVGNYKTDIQVVFANGDTNTIFPADVNKVGIFRITPQVTKGGKYE